MVTVRCPDWAFNLIKQNSGSPHITISTLPGIKPKTAGDLVRSVQQGNYLGVEHEACYDGIRCNTSSTLCAITSLPPAYKPALSSLATTSLSGVTGQPHYALPEHITPDHGDSISTALSLLTLQVLLQCVLSMLAFALISPFRTSC